MVTCYLKNHVGSQSILEQSNLISLRDSKIKNQQNSTMRVENAAR